MHPILHPLRRAWKSFRKLPSVIQIASATLVALLAVLVIINLPLQRHSENIEASQQRVVNLTTQTVGAENEAFATFASWPGEIISPNDVDVQPPRSGTVVSWDVGIGKYVNAGQVLGRLSAAPLTPELASTLAAHAAALAQAKAKINSTQTFVTQSKDQLTTFSSNDTAVQSIEAAKLAAIAAGGAVTNVLRQSIVKEYAVFSGSSRDVLSTRNNLNTTPLSWNFGATTPSLRDKYLTATGKALDALDGGVPEQAGKEYYLAATQLVSASISGGDFSQAQLDSLRASIATDAADFNAAIERYRGAILLIAEKQKEAAERTRDTANKGNELDREYITAKSDLQAAEETYSAVSGAITGGTAIVAPKSGYVSALMSQIGEFVEPGKAVASISSGIQTNKIVRFRIPNNVEVPQKGNKVRIIRPGFAKDVRTAVITGVGTALDGNGSFMADARIEGALEWPAHLSVRVVPVKQVPQTIAVPFDAVFWDEENHPHVWLVGEGGVIASRAVKTGRTFGDAVEILVGLKLGDTYLSLPTESVREGMRIKEAAVPVKESVPTGDGHGHAHDE